MLKPWSFYLYIILFYKILFVICTKNGSSLTFVIDDTYSMEDDIAQVRAAVSEIMDIVTTEKTSEIENIVLVTFNDPEFELREKTSNKQKIIEALNEIVVHSNENYDCPEYSLSGIKKALEESNPGSYLYVFTDATAKDYHKVNEIKSLCEKKQSQVVFVLTGDCKRPHSENYKVYHEIAKASNGQVHRLEKTDVKAVLDTIKELIKGQKSVVTSQIIPETTIWYPVPFTVDDKAEYVFISTSGKNVDLVVMDQPDRGGAQMKTDTIMSTTSVKVVKFVAPKPDTYYAWVKGDTVISVVVFARTDFTFDHGFSTFVPKSLEDTSKQPIADLKQYLSISVTDPKHTVDIKTAEILDMEENVLQSLTLRKASGDFYITDQFVSPSSMFKIQVIGTNKETGNEIKRISKTAIEPQIPPKPDSKAPKITIKEGTKVDVNYDGETRLTCSVSAYPEPNIVWTNVDGTVLSSETFVVEPPYDYINYLKLKNVQEPGTYYCRASNEEAKNIFSKINVNPLSPFKIIPTFKGTETAVYGEEKKLRCGITSSQPMKIEWKMPLKPSEYSLSADKTVLTIKAVDINAQGQYNCVATLISNPKHKQAIATNVVITNLVPPTFSNASPSQMTASVGEKVNILCKIAGGVPRPSINWQVMKNTDNVFKHISESGEVLTIDRASLTDAGQYRCIATNAKGHTEKVTNLIVQQAPTVVINEGFKKSVGYGSTNELTCKIVAYPLPTIVWKDSRGNKLSSQDNINNNEITSRLQIKAIKASDTYSCYAENKLGLNVSSIVLSVMSAILIDSRPPAITTSKYERATDITCNIKSIFPLKIKWYRQGPSNTLSEIKTSDMYKVSRNGKMLRILSTDSNNIGKYTCKAYLVDDENQNVAFTTDIKIIDLSPPVIHNTTSKFVVNAEQKTTIPCKIDGGTPPPTVSWQFMQKGENVFKDLPVSGQVLTIPSTSLSNAGKYRCIAKNSEGLADKTNELIVKKAPDATIDEGATLTVPYGSTKEFHCKIVAYPLPTIVWRDSKGHELNSKNTINKNEIISQLKVLNAKASDTYSCYAENDLGKTVKSVHVSVSPAIVFPTNLPETKGVNYGASSNILCDARSTFQMRIKWFYQKNKSPSDRLEIHTSDKYIISPDEKTLHIKSTDLELVGKYTCEASLVSDENEKKSYTTEVEINNLMPPTFSNASPSQMTASVGEKVNILCKIAGGVPRPSINWQVMKNTDNVFKHISESGEVLTIDRASLTDAGQYRCIATNAKGHTEKVTNLIVQQAPTVVINEGFKKSVGYGSTNELTCKIVAYPLPTIVWKDSRGNKLSSQDNINNNEITSRLQIKAIKASDTYSCYAENKLGLNVSSIVLSVMSAILIDSRPPAITTSKYGTATDITCNIKSIFPLKIKWYRQGPSNTLSEIKTSDMYKVSRNGKMLRILSTDSNNIGKYICKAYLVDDENQNVAFTTDIKIIDLSPPVIHNTTSKFVVHAEQKTTIPCKIDGGTPPPTVSWQFMQKGENVFKDLPVSGQVLTIPSTSLSNAGKYRCIAKNSEGLADKTNELIVKKAPEATIDEGATLTVPYGSTKEFHCKIVAYPLPTIVWRDSKGHEFNSKKTINNNEIISQLKVVNAKASDTYSCYAENELGKTVKSVHVSVSPAIVFPTNLPETKGVNYGASSNILCDARSTFQMRIKWFYQKNKSPSDRLEIHTSDKYIISPDEKTLHIKSTDLELVGKYRCEASLVSDENEKKSYTTEVEINNLKVPEVTASDETAIIMNGKKMAISCKANGIPKPVITWKFKPKNSNDFVLMPDQGEFITKPKIGYENAGSYECTASNAVGIQKRIINVNVHGEPKITNDDSIYFGVTGDKVLQIPCNVSGVPEPTVIWKREGKLVTSDAKITVDKNNIFINNPTAEDSGNFTCEANNKYGNTKKNFEAEVSDFIEIDKENSKYIYLKPGESTVMKCDLPHDGPQSIRWYVNADNNTVVAPSYSLQNAKFENDGNYTCRANTKQGSISQNYIVDVGFMPSFLRPVSKPIYNWNGNKHDILDCNVQAKPQANVKWFHNGRPLKKNTPELSLSDWGDYTCIVSNVHGTVQQTYNVTSTGCVIDRTVYNVQNTPLIISDTPITWTKLTTNNEFYIVKKDEVINLACSTTNQPENTFKTQPNAKEISAKCYKEDQFTVNGKNYKFKDLQCAEYIRPSLVSTTEPCMTNGEIIEVGFKLKDDFLKAYDVCYSETDQRTLFSKVTMSDINMGNIVKPTFKLNPGLTSKDGIVKCQYNQRRLVNPVDVPFGPAQIATLSDKYNTVPVFEPCDGSSRMPWINVENEIKNTLYIMENFDVWTGASNFSADGVPRYLWKVVKFDDSIETIVYVNAPDPVANDILCTKTTFDNLGDIGDIDQYTYLCSLSEFTDVFKVPLSYFEVAW